jgi:hypothetical protein
MATHADEDAQTSLENVVAQRRKAQASLIMRAVRAMRDKHNGDRLDPVLKPVIAKATERYDLLVSSGVDFTEASDLSVVGMIEDILAMDL